MVKVYGVRIEEETIRQFKIACLLLPVPLKPSELIDSYMKSVILAGEEYRTTGNIDLNITVDGKSSFRLLSKDNDDYILSGDTASKIIKDKQ